MMSSRVTLATMDAAAIDIERESPRTTVSTRQGRSGGPVAVDQCGGGAAGQGGQRPRHRGEGRAQYVVVLDLAHARRADADLGAEQQIPIKVPPRGPGQGFRVVEASGEGRG